VRLVEGLFELVQLIRRERRPVSSMFLALGRVVVDVISTVANVDAVAQQRSRLPFRFAVVRALCRPAETSHRKWTPGA